MVWSPLLTIHIFGGIVGFLSGSMAMVVPKGGRLHRRSGDVFVLAMLGMAASGGVLAMVRGQGVNVVAGLFTFYLVTSAWLTVRHKERETGPGEVALLVMALAIGLGAWIARWNAAHHAAGLKSGDSAAYFIFGLLTLACAAGDGRMLVRGGVSGARRLVRHVWRMGFALFIATASFFLGRAGDPVLRQTGLRARLFTDAIRKTHLPEIPVYLVAILTIFWVCRLLVAKAYRRPAPRERIPLVG